MTVADLIAELQAIPQDTIVRVTDPSCCGCSDGPVDAMTYNVQEKSVFLSGDRYKEAA